MISVSVKDFGPIIEGAIELKPLTVFIGPNNSGKSHMATLVYALMQGDAPRDMPHLSNYGIGGLFHQLYFKRLFDEQDSELAREVNSWVKQRLEEEFDFTDIPVASLPESLVQAMDTASEVEIRSRFVDTLSEQMTRCFGAEISALSHVGVNGSKKFSVSMKQDKPEWRMNALPNGNGFEAVVSAPSLAEETVTLGAELSNRRLSRFARQTPSDYYRYMLANATSSLVVDVIHREFPDRAYYLPAARSGILQSHKQLASAIVRRSALAGIEPLEVGRLPGVVADFIGELLTLQPESQTELYEVAEFLEKKIARGQVYLEAAGVPYPEIYYEAQGQKYPMHRASSMVSELAPLILYLKHRLAPGDLLIFEEPESHLHPANQRILAHAIVKMVRKGVKVMLTTHSDYFLPQLGNFVRLSALEDERAKMGYGADDYLNPEDVGCYLFKLDYEEGGSIVRELETTAEDGIPEDEFADVGEALYNEYADLYNAHVRLS